MNKLIPVLQPLADKFDIKDFQYTSALDGGEGPKVDQLENTYKKVGTNMQ